MKIKPKLWCCLYDIHHPKYDKKTFRAILSFMRQNRVAGLLLGGDARDLSCVSPLEQRSAGDPAILKKINPASAVISLTVPGVIDCVADNAEQGAAVGQEVDAYQAATARGVGALESTVNRNLAPPAPRYSPTRLTRRAKDSGYSGTTSIGRSRHSDQRSSKTKQPSSTRYTLRTRDCGSTSPASNGSSARIMKNSAVIRGEASRAGG